MLSYLHSDSRRQYPTSGLVPSMKSRGGGARRPEGLCLRTGSEGDSSVNASPWRPQDRGCLLDSRAGCALGSQALQGLSSEHPGLHCCIPGAPQGDGCRAPGRHTGWHLVTAVR